MERPSTSSDIPDPRTAMARSLMQSCPGEAALVLRAAPADDLATLLVTGGLEMRVLSRLMPEQVSDLLGRVNEAHARVILTELDPSQAADALARLPEERRLHLLGLLDPRPARELADLVAYPADSAGGLMDPRVAALREELTVEDALAHLRRQGREVYDLYLVDDEGRLRGAVPIQRLALSTPDVPLMNIAREQLPSVQAITGREELVEMFTERPLPSLPVVDFEGRLVGVVRHHALVGAAEQEATVDIQKMMGASSEERALSPSLFAVRKRLPWLLINLATAGAAAAVVGMFEGLLAKVSALAVLLPVVAGQSGNTGSQALAVTMRGLALREVRTSHWRRLALKEGLAGAINGVAVAIVCAFGVLVWSYVANVDRGQHLAMVLFLSMIVSMVMAGLSGASVPIILKAVGQDPATASSIILTTVTDIVGFFSFLGIATLLLT